MRNSVAVSVCVSVYNGEKYLKNCLENLLAQTILDQIEIVCVNNGSTDSSEAIMNEYQRTYPNIISVFRQSNLGLAQGRQSGINKAKGEYIAFLDVDDTLAPTACETVYTIANDRNIDIVEFKTRKGETIVGSDYRGIYDSHVILEEYFHKGQIPSMLWLRFYRRALFYDKVMPSFFVNNEDIFAYPLLLFRAKSIYFLDETLHEYNINNIDSVMNVTKSSDDKANLDNRLKTLQVVPFLKETIGQDVLESQYSDSFRYFEARTILNFALSKIGNMDTKSRIELALTNTGSSLELLNGYFKSLKHYNSWIQLAVNTIGLFYTVSVYNFITKRIK